MTRPAAAPLTDEQIIAIRDDCLPSQGERFDCIAFARAILLAASPSAAPSPAPAAEQEYDEYVIRSERRGTASDPRVAAPALDEKLSSLPPERRAKIEQRATALVAPAPAAERADAQYGINGTDAGLGIAAEQPTERSEDAAMYRWLREHVIAIGDLTHGDERTLRLSLEPQSPECIKWMSGMLDSFMRHCLRSAAIAEQARERT